MKKLAPTNFTALLTKFPTGLYQARYVHSGLHFNSTSKVNVEVYRNTLWEFLPSVLFML